ncbi:oocyte zinc finger protein XlCOF6-like [Anopheles bellator]|uniref:oocyte zinc finger protein XlCOF6-like n=1 Tax=Anopheles bellator TaxID=139047 RepID=UPI002649FA80|nr:oocyte zinc finger protein XlCOF6-like [Anopheles bellator]
MNSTTDGPVFAETSTSKSLPTPLEKALLQRFCRLCMREFPFLLPFNSSLNSSVTIGNMLERLLGGFNIQQTLYLPNAICSRCLTKLDFAYHAQRDFVRNEHRLRHYLQQGEMVQKLFEFQNHCTVERESYAEVLLKAHGAGLLGERVGVTAEHEVPGMQDAELEAEKLSKAVLPPSDWAVVACDCSSKPKAASHGFPRSMALRPPKRALRNRQLLRQAITAGSSPSGTKTMPVDMTRCYICNTPTESETALRDHIALHVEMLPHSCPECSLEGPVKPIISVVMLLRHYRMHSYPLKCPQCPQRFTRYASVYAHVRYRHEMFDNPEGFTCEICGLTIKYRPTFTFHMRNHHHEQMGTFRCTFCERTFGTRARLERHERSHTGERPFTCHLCPKTFANATQLAAHRSRHINERGHRCAVCGKAFFSKAILRQHQLTHDRTAGTENHTAAAGKTKIRLCTFPGCQFVAATYQMYYTHRLRHEMAYRCDECGRRFARQSELQRHRRIYHTTDHPYRCEPCNKIFLSRQSYREHMDSHENVRRFECETCDRKFVRRRNLINHRMSHSNQRPHKCTFCETSFKYKSDYNRHQKEKHNLPEGPSAEGEQPIDAEDMNGIVLMMDNSMVEEASLQEEVEERVLVEEDIVLGTTYEEEIVTKYETIETVEESVVIGQSLVDEAMKHDQNEYVVEYLD